MTDCSFAFYESVKENRWDSEPPVWRRRNNWNGEAWDCVREDPWQSDCKTNRNTDTQRKSRSDGKVCWCTGAYKTIRSARVT